MEFKRKHAILLLALVYIAVVYATYVVIFKLGPLAPELLRFTDRRDPMEYGYKIFFFSMVTFPAVYVGFLITLIASILYLKKREVKYDLIASNSVKITLIFTTLLLVNGAIFSKVGWGAYWNWDPRQTTTLMLWFILAAYLSLRTAIENFETKARLSAILGILGFFGVPLTHVSATIWLSNHPQLYNIKNKPPFAMQSIGWAMFGIIVIAILVLFFYLLWLSMKIEETEKYLTG